MLPRSAPWIASASAAALLLAACQPAPPDRAAASRAPAVPAVAPSKAAPSPPKAPSAAVAMPSMQLPAGPIYACDIDGARTPIEFPDNVESLCRRHPEMGPCQYERNACRRRGGRVYTSIGEEVTAAVEAEYDRRVRRVTFQSDGAPAKKK
jgi:hypothetical protein